jgi:heme/copper-type cytochrome/quinol oxidase subunit 2
VSRQREITVRETLRRSRHPGWLALLLTILLLSAGATVSAESKKFTLINVLLDGTKIWLPSSVMVNVDDEVELTLIDKLDEPHGFKIEDFGVEELVQPKAQTTVKFTAAKSGVHGFGCQMHPAHIGGQIVILRKEGN